MLGGKEDRAQRNEFFVILIPIIKFKSRQFSPTKILNKNITVQYMQIRRSLKILSKQATVLFVLFVFFLFIGLFFLHRCRSGQLKSSKTAERRHTPVKPAGQQRSTFDYKTALKRDGASSPTPAR